MNSNDLRLAGYASIISAVLSIPILFYTLYTSVIGQTFISNLIQLINLVIYAFVTSKLIELLTDHDFKLVNSMLTTSVILNVIGFVFGVIAPYSDTFGFLSVVGMIVLGILMVLIGINLQKCPDDLHNLLKIFSLTWIISGVCLASIILIPLFILTWIATNIILGMIFFREADKRQDEFSF